MVGITVKSELLIGIGIIIWLITRICILIKNKKIDFKKEFFNFVILIYILWLIGITLFPIDITWVKEYVHERNIVINFNPFNIFQIIKLAGLKIFIINVLGNIFILVPMGIIISIKYKNKNIRYIDMFKIGLLITLTIELMQLLEMYLRVVIGRSVDINDIIFNILGILIGKYVYDNLLKKNIDNKI